MANVILQPNEVAGVFGAIGSTDVFGTIAGSENTTVDGDGVVTFVNSGGDDTVVILADAFGYTASVVGSNLVFTNSGGAQIAIPFSPNFTTTVIFNDATRDITFKNGDVCLGDQVIGGSGSSAAVEEGSNGTGGPDPEPVDEQFLTPNTDVLNGDGASNLFIADMNQVDGLTVNTLGTGDRVDGHAGGDTLESQITRGSTYGDGNAPIQPRLNDVETIKLETMQSDLPNSLNNINTIATGANTQVYFDASDVRGHDAIWSWESDADLIIQNLTTIVADGGHDDARNTSEITIGMGYTGSNDHNWDASDVHAYFDPDFLLSGQTSKSVALYWLLDEDAELAGSPQRLLNINVDGIRFTVNGGAVIELSDPEIPLPPGSSTFPNTHAGFVAALQDELQDLIDAGVVPPDTTLTLDPTLTDTTFLDNGTESLPIPAIVLQTETPGFVIEPVGFSQIEDPIGAYDVYGRIDDEFGTAPEPISVHIALEKAGRGVADCCDAGTMIVGSMDKENGGIPVFDVWVYGDESRPSVLKELDSTGNVLDVMNIASDNDGFPTDTWASLAIGDTNANMTLINAVDFYGDLTLGGQYCLFSDNLLASQGDGTSSPFNAIGTLAGVAFDILDQVSATIESGGLDQGCQPIFNLQTLTATGGGNVNFTGIIEADNIYTYTTGGGNDVINLFIDGDALDMASSSLLIQTGGGNDSVYTNSAFDGARNNEEPNHIILRNVDILTGDGNDRVQTEGEGSYNISTGAGMDYILTDNSGAGAVWIFNFDLGQFQAEGGAAAMSLSDLPGVPLQHSLIGGGQLTVTFSGAGAAYGGAQLGGGGVMDRNGMPGDEGEGIQRYNGIESTVTINVDGSRQYYGTQADINAAIIDAINSSPVLSKVLVAFEGDNNTLIVRSLIDGSFVTEDLDISITRPTITTTQVNSVVSEGIALGLYNSATAPTAATLAATLNNPAGHPSQGQTLDNHFYAGIDNNVAGPTNDGLFAAPDFASINNLNFAGFKGNWETDNVVNGGNDNDVIVLSTDNTSNINNQYWTLDGQLFDAASNEVIVLSGENFGMDTVFNFTVAEFNDYRPESGGGIDGPGAGMLPAAGFDFIDLTAYLTSLVTSSGSQASIGRVLTTLEDQSGGDVVADFAGVTMNWNEVVILDFLSDLTTADGDGIETFAGLTASVVQGAINATLANEWGNFDGGEFALSDGNPAPGTAGNLIGNQASAVIMVQNDQNLGEYKFFEVNWIDDGNPATAPVATVVERGKVDFGASLEGIDEINFILSAEALLHDGFGLNQFGPDVAPVI